MTSGNGIGKESDDGQNSERNLSDIFAALQDQKLPPVHLWNPDVCRDIDMRVGRDGTWYYMGTPINRKRMVKLFSTVLRRDEDGKIYLVTPVEKLGIIVDDAPFVAVEAEIFNAGRDQTIVFRTNVDEEVVADADHPIRVEIDPQTLEPSPYVLVRDGLWALINRPVFYQLVDVGVERKIDGVVQLGIESAGMFFLIGDLEGQPVQTTEI